jgi:hypothetical protein
LKIKKVKRQIFYFFLASFLLSACSIYRSEGRRLFEDRSSGKIRPLTLPSEGPERTNKAALLQQNEIEPTPLNCWSQPARDPIWRLLPSESYSVRLLNNSDPRNPTERLIEICVEVNRDESL